MKGAVNIISRRGQGVAAMLLLLFSFYYINISLFLHYHVVDGVTIVHSHICSSEHASDSEAESHSNVEFTLIAAISNYIVELQSLFILESVAEVETYTLLEVCNQEISWVYSPHMLPKRGPPSLA